MATQNKTVSYGRLVVLISSWNPAGQEFALSLPKVTIGRADDNNVVIKHRSVSRFHATVTRENETGRYRISDLKSTNGVRVNGQPYGKVELRAGDCVDLGHVRFRFVEAGEDFLYARDVVITGVPERGSKKTVPVARSTGKARKRRKR